MDHSTIGGNKEGTSYCAKVERTNTSIVSPVSDVTEPLVVLPAAPYTRYALCGFRGRGETSELKQQWLQTFGSAMAKWSQDFVSVVDRLPRAVEKVRMVKRSNGYTAEIERIVPISFHRGCLDKPAYFNGNGIIVCFGVGDCDYAGDGILVRSGSGRTIHVGSGIIIKTGSGPCHLLNNGIVINLGNGIVSYMPSTEEVNTQNSNNLLRTGPRSYEQSSNSGFQFQNYLLEPSDPRPPVIICSSVTPFHMKHSSSSPNSSGTNKCITIYTEAITPTRDTVILTGCCRFLPQPNCNLTMTKCSLNHNDGDNTADPNLDHRNGNEVLQIVMNSSVQHQVWKNSAELLLSKYSGIQIEDINNCSYKLSSNEEKLCVAGFSLSLKCATNRGGTVYFIYIDTSDFQQNSFSATLSSNNCVTLIARKNLDDLSLRIKVDLPYCIVVTKSMSDFIRISHETDHSLIQIYFS